MGGLAPEDERAVTPCEKQPGLFYPEGYLGKKEEGDIPLDYHSEESMAARALCAGCPFLQECLDGAVERKEPYGIWGGMDPDELVIEGVKRNAMQSV